MKRLALILSFALASPAAAQEAWDDIRAALFDTRAISEAGELIRTDIPYRTPNDLRTQVAAMVSAPPGQWLGKVYLIIDNNPMPVSAVFEFAAPPESFFFDVTMRINGQSPIHVIAETTSGELFAVERFLKTSGTGACAAPPGTDPDAALATLGDMELSLGRLRVSDALSRLSLAADGAQLDIDLSHPSHSGMQKDQITLLYIPFRYVEDLSVDLDAAPYVSMEGSISLSENPRLSLSVPGATRRARVTMTDTEGTITTGEATFGGY